MPDLVRRSTKKYLKYISSKETAAINKTFWKTVKPFVTNKGINRKKNVTIE